MSILSPLKHMIHRPTIGSTLTLYALVAVIGLGVFSAATPHVGVISSKTIAETTLQSSAEATVHPGAKSNSPTENEQAETSTPADSSERETTPPPIESDNSTTAEPTTPTTVTPEPVSPPVAEPVQPPVTEPTPTPNPCAELPTGSTCRPLCPVCRPNGGLHVMCPMDAQSPTFACGACDPTGTSGSAIAMCEE